MSIVFGIIRDEVGVVGSDSRVTEGAYFDTTGTLTTKGVPRDAEFDKTFEFKTKNIIGCYAGTVEFSNKSTTEHIEEILSTYSNDDDGLEAILLNIKTHLKQRLEAINNAEILFAHRKIDLIIIGYDKSDKQSFKIYIYRFTPNLGSNTIHILEEIIPNKPKQRNLSYWRSFGDDKAREYVEVFLESEIKNFKGKMGLAFLRNLAYRGIRGGIKNSGKYPYGDHESCGGKPFVKYIQT